MRPTPPLLTIRLFGQLRILVEEEPLPRQRTRSVEWLLALLALQQGRTVERSWLAGTFWPESDEGQALKNLRNNLLYLRTALGPEAGKRIQSPTRDTLTLDLDGVDVDVLRFDQAIRSGDEASLESAVALYAAPLLEGCHEPWALSERDTCEQAFLLALETLTVSARRRADHAAALALLRRAEAIDPLRAAVQRQLMQVLRDSGDAPTALMTYREHRLRLRREVNSEPDEETIRLYQQIRQQTRTPARALPSAAVAVSSDVPPTVAPSPTVTPPLLSTLPHPLTPLIGREQEVREMVRHLGVSRLVTLVGTGGVGKTRLSIEVARDAASNFADGALFVALASLSDPAMLPAFLAAALGLRDEKAQEAASLREALAGWFAGRAMLLVLDNCEHLIEATAPLAQTLLEQCPHLRILATSRQRLGLTGEIVCRVPSLPVPDPERLSRLQGQDPESYVRQYSAVRLFLERAAMAHSEFRLVGQEEALAVAQICRRLDGIPLAIELAAARVGPLSVVEIAGRLDDRFRLLTGGSRAVLPRHQTLRALIDWSYNQLAADEQALLCRLSVFVGGWTLNVAEEMVDSRVVRRPWSVTSEAEFPDSLSPRHPTPETQPADRSALDLLTSLVDKSLVLTEKQPSGVRYRMLETVCEYALEKLRESGSEEDARAWHAGYCLALAARARPYVAKPEPHWLNRLEAEHDNIRAALTYYGAREETIHNAAWMATALEQFWNLRGHYYERRAWLVGLARRPLPQTRARADLLICATYVVASDGDFTGAKQMLTESLAIARDIGDQKLVAAALNGLSNIIGDAKLAGAEYDVVAARGMAEGSLAIMRELDDKQGIAHSLYLLGHLARKSGDTDEARSCWLECRVQDQKLGVKGGLVLRYLGELALESGDYTTAHDYYRAFLSERQEVGERWGIWWSLQGLGELADLNGDQERAARLRGASLAVRESIAHPLSPSDRAFYARWREAIQQSADAVALIAAWEDGLTMTMEQITRYALAAPSE